VNHSIYHYSAPVFTHNLKNLAAILKTAARDAKTRGIDPAVLLSARLAPDMLPLTRQVQIATDHAKGSCSRLAGQPSPVFEDKETSFAELDARIGRALGVIRALKPAQFEGAESREIVMDLPIGKLRFKGIDYLNGWALPNFWFHYCATYNILRHNGVPLGKMNFLGAIPGMQATGKIAKMMGQRGKPKAKKKA